MFDVGFFELLMIGIVALIVIGPERLPKVARTAGMWLGRARRFVGSVKQDIEQEMRTDELKRILEEQKQGNPMHSILDDDMAQSLDDLKKQTESMRASINEGMTDVQDKKDGG